MGGSTRILLITANIATCFEEPDDMLKAWLDQLLKGVGEDQPGFVALHCQEVGGKNYLSPTNTRENFIKMLLSRPELQDYTRSLVYLDGMTAATDKFTALGNLYFIHKDVGDVLTWNFKEGAFVAVEGRSHHIGCIEDVPTKEKDKFPQEFFPECKWGRKGIMRTRWRLNGTDFDLINIHLFHDPSNFIAMKESPSVYSLNRRRTLYHTLDRFHNDSLENVPFFIFGDFNFRLDGKSVLEILSKDSEAQPNESATDEEMQYFLASDTEKARPLLTISKRHFRHHQHQTVFRENMGKWLRPFDLEAEHFSSRMTEMPITFQPSYPFMEEPELPQTPPPSPSCNHSSNSPTESTTNCLKESSEKGSCNTGSCDQDSPVKGSAEGCEEGCRSGSGVVGHHYSHTRLPAWCDRIMISTAAKALIDKSADQEVRYQMLGLHTPMGDHKPIFLDFFIKH